MQKFNISITAILFTSLVIINLVIFPIDILKIERGAVIVIVTALLSTICFAITIFFFVDLRKTPKQLCILFVLFLGFIGYPLIISLVRNSASEYLASILRFSSYYFIFISFYFATSHGFISIKKFKPVVSFIVLFCCIISFIQVSSDNMPFMNGAYRLSSIYGATPAGFALLMLFCSIFYFSLYFFDDTIQDKKRVLFWAILSTYMMYATQSRQALATLIIFFFIVLLINSSWVFKIIYSFFISIISLGIYWILLNTSIFPRITDMLTRDDTDSSTQTRKNIIDITINNLDDIERYLGIGLGGFNQYYFSNTGELGIAAHNDFLLFYIEGGFIALISYIIFLSATTIFWFKAYKKYGKQFLVPLSIFVAIYILSFLNNPFYYPQTQVLSAATLGIYLSYYIKYKRCS